MMIMKKLLPICFLSLLFSFTSQAQTTTQFSLTNGDGWYRILEGDWLAHGKVTISGLSGNNRNTNVTMYISLMEFDQGGSIHIANNTFFNQNHVANIRGGSINGKYVLDIELEGIDNPSNITITADTGISVITTPIYNPTDTLTGKIEISGRVQGMASTRYPVFFSNKVGIGTANPDMELTVKGKIHAEEVKVDLNVPAPDYVFTKDYILMSLETLESFIKKNGHLPEIPSAIEFEQNGIMLSEMNMNLLKKIEEITLYTIAQEKKIKKLEALTEIVSQLQQRLEKLESESTSN